MRSALKRVGGQNCMLAPFRNYCKKTAENMLTGGGSNQKKLTSLKNGPSELILEYQISLNGLSGTN